MEILEKNTKNANPGLRRSTRGWCLWTLRFLEALICPCDLRITKKNCIKIAPGAQEVQKSVWHMQCAQWPFNPGLNLYLYPSAVICRVGEIPVSSLYEATENELQVSGMAISKKSTRVLKVTDFEKASPILRLRKMKVLILQL